MSSQMFCELAALNTAELAKCGGDGGKVHRVTAGVVDSRICSFANDAPQRVVGWCCNSSLSACVWAQCFHRLRFCWWLCKRRIRCGFFGP